MNQHSSWKNIYITGAIATLIVIAGVIADIIIGTALGGDVEALPKTAIDRFSEFRYHPWVGLYHLDLLNMVTMVILIPRVLRLVRRPAEDKERTGRSCTGPVPPGYRRFYHQQYGVAHA